MPVNVPEILIVPLVITSQPPTTVSVVTPRTVKLVVVISRIAAGVVPLLTVIWRMSVVAPVPENVVFAVPVKVMMAPAVSALVEKSSVPLLVRLPRDVELVAGLGAGGVGLQRAAALHGDVGRRRSGCAPWSARTGGCPATATE